MAPVVTAHSGARFTFSLDTRFEECFMEEVDARTSGSKLLFRFGVIDPASYDVMDVVVKTPTLKTVQSWNRTQSNHLSTTVRESGLYHLCFRKLGGSSQDFNVFYSFDFISTGTRIYHICILNTLMWHWLLTLLYPNVAATVSKSNPDETIYTAMTLTTTKGEATSLGITEFDLQGVSASLIHPNTRVQLLLSVDSVSKEKVDIAVGIYDKQLQYPLSWNSLGNFVKGEYKERVMDNAVTEMGSHLTFDITELFASRVNAQRETLNFVFYTHEDAEASVFGMSYVTPDYYPQIVVEDLGLDLMREVAYFKETVFTLRGDITYVLHKERGSRNAAESANSRVKWLSLLTNIVLVGIAFAQVVYIRSMLESSY
ncbi:Endosomal protein p24b, partial [Globisporangium splendens]